ncbi:MAG: xylose isomerase [Gemmatimonadetes bacterium]|nr:xylose isomerase [Gemmatimonadota bacterium]MBI2536050.1 xylose isomerase [Gemmatimonadota bacterium]
MSQRISQDAYTPRPEHHFTFGLWTVGNPGRDPFGEPVRPLLSPAHIVRRLAALGAYGVNLHDEDLVPRDATAAERDTVVREFKQVLADTGMKVPMATTNLFSDPAFRDGAFTSNDARVRAYALQKTMKAIDLGVELGATTYVLWGGREGVETNAAKDPRAALGWYRDAINFLCGYVLSQDYDLRFALEAKPNEPRGDIFLPTTGHMLAFIHTLDHPEMVGVNPEVAHERMAGLDFSHAVAQALDAGKLFHLDLNGQQPGRFDQDLRFGSDDPKGAFFLVKLLEDGRWPGMRHFDSHAYRTEDEDGVWSFAHGNMRTYLILKEKVERFNADPEIQRILAELGGRGEAGRVSFSPQQARSLRDRTFDLPAMRRQGYAYERLDQLTMELLLGVR